MHHRKTAYDSLHEALFAAHMPAEGLETILIDQIAQCTWRLNRARCLEQEALENELTAPESETNSRWFEMSTTIWFRSRRVPS